MRKNIGENKGVPQTGREAGEASFPHIGSAIEAETRWRSL